MAEELDVDVVVVGASVAGCTAATIYGRAGLSVALVERSRRPDAYKAMCGHFVLGGAQSTLVRLGLWDEMLAAGASVSTVAIHGPAGWIEPQDDVPPAISLRRQVLDPLLRRTAGTTAGVQLLLGHEVVEILEDGRRVVGVRARRSDGREFELRGRLVVGADGHRSPLARLAGVAEATAPNGRFLYWSYYRGARLHGPGDANVWLLDPDVAVVVPTDDDLTLVGAFPSKDRLADFAGDRHEAIERFVGKLPDGPDLSTAEAVSRVVGTSDYPFVRRPPTPRPGLALVGDAALTSDPVPAVGCAWAFRSAEWLAAETAPELAAGVTPTRGLRRYRHRHALARRYDRIARLDARAKPLPAPQRAIFSAATSDRDLARRVGLFGMRASRPSLLLNPAVVARAMTRSARP